MCKIAKDTLPADSFFCPLTNTKAVPARLRPPRTLATTAPRTPSCCTRSGRLRPLGRARRRCGLNLCHLHLQGGEGSPCNQQTSSRCVCRRRPNPCCEPKPAHALSCRPLRRRSSYPRWPSSTVTLSCAAWWRATTTRPRRACSCAWRRASAGGRGAAMRGSAACLPAPVCDLGRLRWPHRTARLWRRLQAVACSAQHTLQTRPEPHPNHCAASRATWCPS